MQQSYGEESFEVENFTTGRVRVLGVHPEYALYPRIGIRLGVALQDVQPNSTGQFRTTGLTNYKMVNLSGELRLGDNGIGAGALIGLLWPTQRGIDVRSSSGHHEDHVTLACDLDLMRLERIEDQRKGQPPTFVITLWPTITREGQQLRTSVRPVRFQLPRDTWTEFLSGVGFGEYDVLEIKRPVRDLEAFKEVRAQLDLARSRIAQGQYNAAVSSVRTALEHAIQDVRDSGPPLKELLAAHTDAERGEAYAAIITNLKKLCSRAVHKSEATLDYSRAEAQFIVRSTESSIALLGQLLKT